MTTYEQYQIVSTYNLPKIQAAGLLLSAKGLGDIFREQSRLFGLLTPSERCQDLKATRQALQRIPERRAR